MKETETMLLTDTEFAALLATEGVAAPDCLADDDDDEDLGFFKGLTEEQSEELERWLDEKYPEVPSEEKLGDWGQN